MLPKSMRSLFLTERVPLVFKDMIGGDVPYPMGSASEKSGVRMATRIVTVNGIDAQLALVSNPNRKRLLIINMDSNVDGTVNYGAPADSNSIPIPARGNEEFETNCPTDDVWIYSTKVGHRFRVGEGV